ncbi:SIR2 family protein (plasmid) [Agrobacterium tumefaciens]|uniref:SIR2 family protein n=1 Tax=Agrobacterium tumefaciens TaxID=358 RepID=UPI001573DFFD|nr:SIR2 family protein [Agrobacterium tumefaciens]NSZ87628.1 SIR2 family protein [Agrobacterium tumefaciens]WCA72953.1 SIR2 family protein [Agrobacterium tumefaciens]
MSSDDRFDIISIGGKGYDVLLRELSSAVPGVLFGSAVSIFEPTLLQGARPTSQAVARALCEAAGLDAATFASAIEGAAYEALLQEHPARTRLSRVFSNYFLRFGAAQGPETVGFNKCHRAIAHLLSQGRLRGAVTTNYDTCLEQAYEDLQLTKFLNTIVRRSDAARKVASGQNQLPLAPTLFKLHGCARHPKTMIFSLEQEKEMPTWKKRTMGSLLGKTVLVLGYSGLDFEVCPELYDLEIDNLYWMAWGKNGVPDLTSNAKKVLNKDRRRSTVICGDMREFLSDMVPLLSRDLPEARNPVVPALLSDQLLNALDQSGRRLWAARAFAMLSIPTAASSALRIEQAGSEDQTLSREFELVRLDALNHSMRYYDNADANKAMSEDASLPLRDRIAHAIGESGACSMAGDEKRSGAALSRVRDLIKNLTNPLDRKRHLIKVEWMGLLLESAARDPKDSDLKESLIVRFRALKRRAFNVGEHALVDLCEQEVAQLSNVGVTAISSRRDRSSGDIFEQIGNYVGQVTALDTRTQQTGSTELASQLRKRLEKMPLYGLPAWRVYRTLIDFAPTLDEREKLYRLFEESIATCQFHPDYVLRVRETTRQKVTAPLWSET